MRALFHKLIHKNLVAVFLFLYGFIVQITAFPVIYILTSAIEVRLSVVETLVFLWFLIPVVSVFSIIIALIQIRERKMSGSGYRAPLIGLILNALWLCGYLVFIYIVFFVGLPVFIFSK